MTRSQAGDKNVIDERVGGELREVLVEADDQHGIHAEGGDLIDLGAERSQPKRVDLRFEICPRMGLERHGDKRCRCTTRYIGGLPDHRLVATMNAVEITDDDGSPPEFLGNRIVMS